MACDTDIGAFFYQVINRFCMFLDQSKDQTSVHAEWSSLIKYGIDTSWLKRVSVNFEANRLPPEKVETVHD